MATNIQTQGEYPNLWLRGLIQARIRQRADHRCEECGMEFIPGTNLAITACQRNGLPFVGTVHHIDGNKCNCCWRNLVFLCNSCHYRLHLLGWTPGKTLPLRYRNQPPRWIVSRELVYQVHPQLFMFS